ncbi:MAG: AAA family ATPase, partial [Thermoplasmata archaeon]|nr:AAA family ATPase [Thermoplasmata archaeon]
EDLRPQQIKLIGRGEELNLLKANLEDVIIGKGSTVLISGEAGVGKTRLVDELLLHAVSKDVKILAGSSASDIIHPFLTFSKALEKEIDDPLFQEQEHVSFTALFAVDRSGILVAQASSDANNLDADIFAGMLSAVQDFVKDSFGMAGEKITGLGRLEYGDMKIMIEHGSHIFLTAVFKGIEHPDMNNLLRTAVSSIEDDCGEIFDSWSGDMDDVAPIQEKISTLANVKFLVRRNLEGLKLENERIRIADEVLELLKSISSERPLVLLLEDLHWADESSLFVLNYLSRNITREKIMIIGTLRPEMGIDLQTTMEQMSQEGSYTLLPLIQLGSGSILSLVEAMYPGHQFPEPFIDHLASACDGNPFFVIELLRQMKLDGNISTIEDK